MYVGGRLTPVHGLHIYLRSWTCPPTLPALPTPPWRTTCKYLCWPPPPLLSWLNGEETWNNVWASHSYRFESGMLIFVCLWAANVFVCFVISSDLLEVVFFHSEDQKWCIFFSLGCILISLLLLLFLLSKTWGLGGVVVRRRRPWGRACLRCQATRAGAQPAPLGSLAFRWRRWRAHTRSVAMRFLRWWSTSWSTSRSTVSDTNTQSRSSVHRH